MITRVAIPVSTNSYKPVCKPSLGFTGEKDILIIDDQKTGLENKIEDINWALGDKQDEYVIHTALGGDEGLQKVKECQPSLTVTAFHMPEVPGPDGGELIKKLKKQNTSVIVKTHCWYGEGDKSRRIGIQTCEGSYGADKYVFEADFRMFANSVSAILNGQKPPKYVFPYNDHESKGGLIPNSSQSQNQDSNNISNQIQNQSPQGKKWWQIWKH
jgi:DNA-binding NarL/FixJ family response regulator